MSSFSRNLLCGRSRLENAFCIQGQNVARALCKSTNVDRLGTGKPYEAMPRIPIIPFLGSSWAYLPIIGKYNINKLHKADIDKYYRYGPVVREKFGQIEIVSSYDPETMQILAENEGVYPSRSDFSSLKVYRQMRREFFEPEGFLVSQGQEWYDMRESLTRYLTQSTYLQDYLEPLSKIASDFVELIASKTNGKREIEDALPHLRKWALECVTHVTLNTRLGCLEANTRADADCMRILNAVETQLACMYKLEASSGNFPVWKYIPTPTWLKFKKAADAFTALSYKYIIRAIHENTSQFIHALKENPTPLDNISFLQYILLREGVTITTAVVTIADMILAGLGTTSHTAGFLLYNLARNPEKQELAYQEIRRLLPNEDDKITQEVYDKLGYLKSCLKESMRLHPTVRGNVRVLNRDAVIGGYRVPAGTTIICVLQLINRSEKYFTRAHQFIPERWGGAEAEKINKFAYQPFGYGKRDCLGKNLAEMEIITLLTQILRKYTVEYHYEDIDMNTRLINVPDRILRFKFIERKQVPRPL